MQGNVFKFHKYSELIDLKKESLEASKDEADYEDEVADKVKEIAKLQAQIDALSLDDSREAQAEKASLLEEMAELQADLDDTQASHALDAQLDALDDMEEAYEKEKDAEIDILEDSISSYQKLYSAAIDYIENHWDTLYFELIEWNTQYGSVLNSEITTAWENALAAAQKYGSYVAALNAVNASSSTSLGSSYSSSSSSSSTTLTKDTTNSGYSNADMVSAIVSKMKQNAAAWHSASNSERDTLQSQNQTLGAQLAQYGVGAYLDPDTGVWYISSDALNSSNAGKKLFECYHTGGVVGGVGDLDDDEALAKLQNGETVLTKAMWENVTTMLDRMAKMEQAFGNLSALTQGSQLPGSDILDRASTVSNVTNNSQPVNISFGDTIIQGNASSETVAQHTKVTNDMVEQIAKILRIGR